MRKNKPSPRRILSVATSSIVMLIAIGVVETQWKSAAINMKSERVDGNWQKKWRAVVVEVDA